VSIHSPHFDGQSVEAEPAVAILTSPADDQSFCDYARSVWKSVRLIHHSYVKSEASQVPVILYEEILSFCIWFFGQGKVPLSIAQDFEAFKKLGAMTVSICDGEHGVTTELGMPVPQYWQAFQDCANALKPKPPKQKRNLKFDSVVNQFPATDLRKYEWIAREFGRIDSSSGLWIGPFYKNGHVSQALIEREMAEPGSVLPADFDPDAGRRIEVPELTPVDDSLVSNMQRALVALNPEKENFRPDPLSIEDLLREGQLIEAICNSKRCTEAEVFAVAERIGVKPLRPQDLMRPVKNPDEGQPPSYWKTKSDQLLAAEMGDAPNPGLSADPGVHERQAIPSGSVASTSVSGAELVGDELETALRDVCQGNPDITTPEAVSLLKGRGHKFRATEVGRALSAIRRSP